MTEQILSGYAILVRNLKTQRDEITARYNAALDVLDAISRMNDAGQMAEAAKAAIEGPNRLKSEG